MGLGGVAIAVPPYVIHPKTVVLGRAGGVIISALGHIASLQQATSIAGILHRRHKAAVTILKANNSLQPSVITHS